MADDERRDDIEAVAYVLHEAPPEADLANVARECIAALDRVRDARGDDEAARIVDYLAAHDEPTAAAMVAALFGRAAWSPQGEDHACSACGSRARLVCGTPECPRVTAGLARSVEIDDDVADSGSGGVRGGPSGSSVGNHQGVAPQDEDHEAVRRFFDG